MSMQPGCKFLFSVLSMVALPLSLRACVSRRGNLKSINVPKYNREILRRACGLLRMTAGVLSFVV